MIRFDMSEFKEEHSAALLYGAPPVMLVMKKVECWSIKSDNSPIP